MQGSSLFMYPSSIRNAETRCCQRAHLESGGNNDLQPVEMSLLCAATFVQAPCRRTRSKVLRRPAIASNLAVENRWAGKILGPSQDKNIEWWDDQCLFHPIVVVDPASNSEVGPWRMYYYGRNRSSWHSGVAPALLSTGRVGMAVSRDGVSWTRFPGSLPEGAILDPDEQTSSAFDNVHVGCTDVFFFEGEWWMYYLGGSLEETDVAQGRVMKGMKMRTGLVKSKRGLEFLREGSTAVLDVGSQGEWDSMFVAWARVLPPSSQQQNWLMTYSSMERTPSPRSAIGLATSCDGRSWHKLGKVLEAGKPGCWDDGGVSRRHVLKSGNQYLMFYEGVNRTGVHGIGLAISGDGVHWEKDVAQGGEPGGPVFTARLGEDAWDNAVVAAPHVVCLDDGSFRLYYVGNDSTKKSNAIGMAVSHGSDFKSWKRNVGQM